MAAELEDERAREAALVEALEDVVTELEGPAVDAEVLARLSGDQVELVREVVQGGVEPGGVPRRVTRQHRNCYFRHL